MLTREGSEWLCLKKDEILLNLSIKSGTTPMLHQARGEVATQAECSVPTLSV